MSDQGNDDTLRQAVRLAKVRVDDISRLIGCYDSSSDPDILSIYNFSPTHRIVFTPVQGPVETYEVMVWPSGVAYTREEWDAAEAADWEVSEEGEWTCLGEATPGGANGIVKVLELGQPAREIGVEMDTIVTSDWSIITGQKGPPTAKDWGIWSRTERLGDIVLAMSVADERVFGAGNDGWVLRPFGLHARAWPAWSDGGAVAGLAKSLLVYTVFRGSFPAALDGVRLWATGLAAAWDDEQRARARATLNDAAALDAWISGVFPR